MPNSPILTQKNFAVSPKKPFFAPALCMTAGDLRKVGAGSFMFYTLQFHSHGEGKLPQPRKETRNL